MYIDVIDNMSKLTDAECRRSQDKTINMTVSEEEYLGQRGKRTNLW